MRLPAYRNYLLTLLAAILAFNFVDRQALGLLLQGIKTDLSLSDTQLGLVTGIAFALFYSLLGIPIARWADRGHRVRIIAITTSLWSVAVALCGAAGSFLQLLLIRVVVGIGEAGCIPPANSVIADYFSRAERPRAVAKYMLGGQVSAVVSYFAAGWLNELYGWRVTFVLLGLPGLALGALAWLTLREPRYEKAAAGAIAPSDRPPTGAQPLALPSIQPSLRDVCATLWANSTFKHLLACLAVSSLFAAGMWQWQPAFLLRTYGLKTGELGTWLAIVSGLAGLAGTYLGGELASRYATRNENLQLRVMAAAYVGSAFSSAAVYLSPNLYLAFGFIGLTAVGFTMTTAPYFALVQTLVPEPMRASSIAIIYLFSNLIGAGLGPLVAGAVSDTLRPIAGHDSLRYSLLALCPGYFWGAWHLWRASQTVIRDVEVTNSATKAQGSSEPTVQTEPSKPFVA